MPRSLSLRARACLSRAMIAVEAPGWRGATKAWECASRSVSGEAPKQARAPSASPDEFEFVSTHGRHVAASPAHVALAEPLRQGKQSNVCYFVFLLRQL